MNFNEQQRNAIYSQKPLVVISAGAGSGKTRVLTERYIHICAEELNRRLTGTSVSAVAASVSQIVAITFTNKAAREMKDRIRSRILAKIEECAAVYESQTDREAAARFWTEQKEALDSAAITTFHSFCLQLLREYSFEAGVLPGFQILDEVEVTLFQKEILKRLFNDSDHHDQWNSIYQYYDWNYLPNLIQSIYAQLREEPLSENFLLNFEPNRILEKQKQMLEEEKRCLFEGFYRRSLQYVRLFPSFSSLSGKIADYMRDLTDAFARLSHQQESPDRSFRLIKDSMPATISAAWKKNDSLSAFIDFAETEWKPLKEQWKAFSSCTPEQQETLKQIIQIFASILSAFHNEYERVKRERAVLDFADLQQKALQLLENPQIQETCRKRFLHFMIDEFQDTNAMQMELVNRIHPMFRFLVGDEKQSIYRFRGADVSLMRSFSQQARSDTDGDFIDMSTNYRTCHSIIQFVNTAFRSIIGNDHYSDLTAARNGEVEQTSRIEFLPVRLEPADSQDVEEPDGQAEDTASNEYEIVAMRMLQMVAEGKPLVQEDTNWRAPKWRDMAILIPTRTNLSSLERSLKSKGIPYVVYGGIGFYQKQEVQDLFTLVKWLNSPWEELHILALLRSPICGLDLNSFLRINQARSASMLLADFIYEGHFLAHQGLPDSDKEGLSKLRELFFRWIPFTPHASLKEALLELFVDSGLKLALLMQPNQLQAVKNVEKFIEILQQIHAYSLEELIQQVDLLAEQSQKEGEAEIELAEGDMVHIMTVHASKGLEFPIVFLPGLARLPRPESGAIRFHREARLVLGYQVENEEDPLTAAVEVKSPAFEIVHRQASQQSLEEEKRLFYVAVTRARDYLVLSSQIQELKDPQKDNTWYKMLSRALGEELSPLQTIDNVFYEGKWEVSSDVYRGPTLDLTPAFLHSVSVTEVMDYVGCPRSFYYKHILRLNSSWFTEDRQESSPADFDDDRSTIDSSQLGSLVHIACEMLDSGFAFDEAIQEALYFLNEEDERNLYQPLLSEFVRRYLQLDLNKWGKSVANEWEFSLQLDETMIKGQIDKVLEKEGRYHIVDLKTNRVANKQDLIERYKPQLHLYKMAYEKINNVTIDQTSLLFLQEEGGDLTSVFLDSNYEVFLLLSIEEMANLKREQAGQANYRRNPGDQCGKCPFESICKE